MSNDITINGTSVSVGGVYAGEADRWSRPSKAHVWKVPADYRSTGYFISTQCPGDDLEAPACRQKDAEYIGFVSVDADPDMVLDMAKTDKMSEIVAGSDAALAALTASYSGHEKLSWPKQETEALAYDADPSTQTPLLSAIAASRGIELSVLVEKVLANVATYEQASGTILGMQQGYEDLLDAAETVSEVQAIVPDFSLPPY